VVAPPRAETLVAPPLAGAATMIGMDDPALAARVARSVLDRSSAEGGAAMTWTLLADDARTTPAPAASTAERSVPPVSESEMLGAGRAPRRLPERDNIVLRDDEGALRPVLVGVAVGALAGIAGSSWFGGSAVSWWAGGALAGAVLVLGIRRSWTSRNE
jgi:hypothetical protein